MEDSKISTNLNYIKYNIQMDDIKTKLERECINFGGYEKNVILDRIMQRVVELSLYPYSRNLLSSSRSGLEEFCLSGTEIECARFSFLFGEGDITISPYHYCRNLVDFLLRWVKSLVAILFPSFRDTNQLPATLIYGVGSESLFVEKADNRFEKFCEHGPIDPLRSGHRFFVETTEHEISISNPSKYVYCRNPLIFLLRCSKIGIKKRLELIRLQFVMFYSYLYHISLFPPLCLLGADFAYDQIASMLIRENILGTVILTAIVQPLWVQSLGDRVHMIWYSQGWVSHTKKYDNITSYEPTLRWVRARNHWVWTQAFKKCLRRLDISGAVNVVGPILFYLPQIRKKNDGQIDIVIFDVPAYFEDIGLKYGQTTNYNSIENLRCFLDDIVSLKSRLEIKFEKKVTFVIKVKRAQNHAYAQAHFDHISNLKTDSLVTVENFTKNLYDLISGSRLVIAYPFTSAAYIAEYLGVPSIYYDPTNSIVCEHFGDSSNLINFCSTKDELLNSIELILQENN